jgi:type I restriction enzyme S subunit
VKIIKLGEVVDLLNGSTPLKTNKNYWADGDVPWFTIDDLRKQGKYITRTEKFITKLGLKESSISLIPENAVLLCCTASVGAIAINKIPLTTNQQFNALIVKDTDQLLVEYLYYWFLANMDLLKSLGRATTIDYVSMSKLKNMDFQLPSLEKQREIVEKLEGAFAEIDQLSDRSMSVLGTANSLLSQLIGSWINSDSTSTKVNLGELAELKGRIGWRGLTAKEYTKEGPLFLSVHSLNHGHFVDFSRAFHISQERYDESPEIHLAEGYILIAKDGAGLGKVGMVGKIEEPTTVNSSLLVVKPKAEIQTKYLYCYFLSSDFQELIKDRLGGSTVPHLYQRDIAKIPVTLLSMEQQILFVEKFDLSSQILEELIMNLKNKSRLLLELKSALLTAEFVAA